MHESNVISKYGCRNGWFRYNNNPVVGDTGDFCYDPSVIKIKDKLRMYMSWRVDGIINIACAESKDGYQWGERKIVMKPRTDVDWEQDVNRAIVIVHDNMFKMWYTAQTGSTEETYGEAYTSAMAGNGGKDVIGYAFSQDGINWERLDKPVMVPDAAWEKNAVMCPNVMFDQEKKIFRMWYAGGGWYEADALGYAESEDGVSWDKYAGNPVLNPCRDNIWEADRISGSYTVYIDGWYYIFYISYQDLYKATLSIARSRNGVNGWERHPENPIITGGLPSSWDCEAVYKPSLYFDEKNDCWLLYYNARSFGTERIGIAIRKGYDLWNV